MRHLFIINPAAGYGNHLDALRPRIEQAAAQCGLTAETVVTQRHGHAVELAQAAVQAAAGGALCVRLYACGGDGTLQEVASGVMREAGSLSAAAVTHVPCGTGNDFIRQFGPDSGRFADIAALMHGTAHPVDVVRAELRGADGALTHCHALNIASIGIDARVSASMDRFRWAFHLGEQMPYNLSAAYHVIKGVHRPYRVAIDGETLDDRYSLIAACNGQFYGGGFHPMPHARLDDGLLDFLLIRQVSRPQVASLIRKYAQGRFEELGDLAVYRRGRRIEVRCESDETVNLDGENFRGQAIAFSLADGRIGFIVPEGMGWPA
jgi:diacylglycerol kinase family enzyme